MKYYCIADHPNQLVTILSYLKLNKINKRESCLVVSHHGYWDNIDKQFINDFFQDILYLDRPDYSFNVIKHFSRLLMARIKIARLGIRSADIILCFSVCQFIENLVISNYPHNRKVLVAPEFCHREYFLDISDCSEILLSRIYNIFIFPLFRMHRTLYLIKKKYLILGIPRKYPDASGVLMYKKKLDEIYDFIYIMKNFNEPISAINSRMTEIHYPYYVFNENASKESMIVIFLGSDFLFMYNLDLKIYIAKINQCLEYIKANFKGYVLFYKPHPRESIEETLLDLDGFKILSKKDNIEMYAIKNPGRIHSVFSFFSTGARNLLNFKINAYVFYRSFSLSKGIMSNYDEMMGGMPKQCFIEDLKKPIEIIFKYD